MGFNGINCEGCDGRCERLFDAYTEGIKLEAAYASDPHIQRAQLSADMELGTNEAVVRIQANPLTIIANQLITGLREEGCTLDNFGILAKSVIREAQQGCAEALYDEMQEELAPQRSNDWPPPVVPFSDRQGQIQFETNRFIQGRGWDKYDLQRNQRLEIWDYLGRLGLM